MHRLVNRKKHFHDVNLGEDKGSIRISVLMRKDKNILCVAESLAAFGAYLCNDIEIIF